MTGTLRQAAACTAGAALLALPAATLTATVTAALTTEAAHLIRTTTRGART